MVARDEIGILIVEPSDTYQRIVSALLQKLGFTRLFKASNPYKAMVLLQGDKRINVVIAELMMPNPEMGVDFVRQVRNKYKAEQLPILIMTNHSEKVYVQQAVAAGINGYLIKPLNPDYLEAQLWRFFDLPLRGQQRLGEALVKQGLVTTEQRDLALDFQKQYSSDFHSMAVQALFLDYISEEQVVQIVFKNQLDDDGFFAAADELGLSNEQVSHLRAIKERYRLRIGDILVKFGLLTAIQLDEVLTGLHKPSSQD